MSVMNVGNDCWYDAEARSCTCVNSYMYSCTCIKFSLVYRANLNTYICPFHSTGTYLVIDLNLVRVPVAAAVAAGRAGTGT